jgi:hypothetical protein
MQAKKQALVSFDIRDDANSEIPILTAIQTRTLASIALLSLADIVLNLRDTRLSLTSRLGRPLKGFDQWPYNATTMKFIKSRCDQREPQVMLLQNLQESLLTLVVGNRRQGAVQVKKFIDAPSGTLRHRLWETRYFRVYLRQLAEHFYLTAAFNPEMLESGTRRVVKIQCEHVLTKGRKTQANRVNRSIRNYIKRKPPDSNVSSEERKSRFHRASKFIHDIVWDDVLRPFIVSGLQSLCLWPFSILQEAHAASASESFHIEVLAPTGTKIVGMRTFIRPPSGPTDGTTPFIESETRNAGKIVRKQLGNTPVHVRPDLQSEGEHTVGHSVIRKPVPLGYSLLFQWRLAPVATGWLLMAVTVCVLAFVSQLLIAATTLPPPGTPELVDRFLKFIQSFMSRDANFAQNRAALVVGVAALATAALVRQNEHSLTKRMLLFPRLCVVFVNVCLLISAVQLLLGNPFPAGFWTTSLVLLAISGLGLLFLIISLLCAIGVLRRPIRRIRHHRNDKRVKAEQRPEYWRVWSWV